MILIKCIISYQTVLQWFHLFKSGRETTEDDHRTGRPLSALNEKDVDTARCLISQDVRYTVEEIAMLSGINSSAVFTILKQQLRLRNVCAIWIPHLLTGEQKQNRLDCAEQLFGKIRTL